MCVWVCLCVSVRVCVCLCACASDSFLFALLLASRCLAGVVWVQVDAAGLGTGTWGSYNDRRRLRRGVTARTPDCLIPPPWEPLSGSELFSNSLHAVDKLAGGLLIGCLPRASLGPVCCKDDYQHLCQCQCVFLCVWGRGENTNSVQELCRNVLWL